MKDDRLEKVETVIIPWEQFKKALRLNYLQEDSSMFHHSHSFVLRLTPPFESDMSAEYYQSEQGVRYNNEWNEKPFHIKPEMLLLEGTDKGTNPFRWTEWPTERTTRNHLSESELEECDIDELVAEGREIFWDEMKSFLPETFCLGKCHSGLSKYEVDLVWDFDDE
jgi:hypothetical protein